MNNFSKILLSSVVGLTSIFTGVEAKAAQCYFTTDDDHVCIHSVYSNKYGTEKNVYYTVNGEARKMNVTCNPQHRYNYRENVAGISCFEWS